jgi:hypothetical protein
MRQGARHFAAGLLCLTLASQAADAPHDALAEGFANPPPDARPLVYWQWVNGNVSQEGIRLDLEWMKRIGLAGAVMFDIGFRTPPVPQFVSHRVGYGTPAWEKAIAFAASEARRLGLLLGAQSSGGWSVSGGPGVLPDQAMKKLVWSETELTASSPDNVRLPAPPSTSGPYQDIPIDNPEFREPSRSGDVAVIAFRLPDVEQAPPPRAVLSGTTKPSLLDDGRFSEISEVVPDDRGYAWLSASMKKPPRSLTVGVPRGAVPDFVLEAGEGGVKYTEVKPLPGTAAQASSVITLALPANHERFWRIRFSGLKAPLALTEARFDYGARVHRVQEKAGFGTLVNYSRAAKTGDDAGTAVDPALVIDLTSRMNADGTVSWRPDNGRWVVQRFGWSLTGRRNVPATAESVGLEVDKLDAAAVRTYAEDFFDRYARVMENDDALAMAFTDSWEAGQQSWTPRMFEEFMQRRGYDLRRWLPVLTGRVVGDAQQSERLLADFRRTIAELLLDHHYSVLANVAHRRGMTYAAQAAGTDIPTVIDGLAAKGRVDMPTGEFWVYPEDSDPDPRNLADVREAASAAHIYGRKWIAAESLTSRGEEPWAQGPAQWRRMVDRFFAEGVNRVILHTSVHQPFIDRAPGITLRQYGQHFTRNETWAEDAGAWVDYLARSSYLLQQGRHVADIAIYLGEDPPGSRPFEDPEDLRLAEGFDFDFLNTEALLQLAVRNGRLVLPSGASYRLIVTGRPGGAMSLAALGKLNDLMKEGASVVGSAPVRALGLADDESRFLELAGGLWGGDKVSKSWGPVGRGYLFSHFRYAIEQLKPVPDVSIPNPHQIHWTHRQTGDADIYFVHNASKMAFAGSASFRQTGQPVELWDAVDGSRIRAKYQTGSLTTSVQLNLAPRTSIFVVFRAAVAGDGLRPAPGATVEAEKLVSGSWDVEFLDGRGAPSRTRQSALVSWTANSDPAIRFHSGRARYSQNVRVPAEWLSEGRAVALDLGAVGELARVTVNGVDIGTWWCTPYRGEITGALHAGDNRIEVVVTNYWANRLIGDEQPGAGRVTFSSLRPYGPDAPLRPSGLLGPVRLIAMSPRGNRAAFPNN